ncbi:MAG: response regulator transcription factor [Salinivirgaceae bacterium]
MSTDKPISILLIDDHEIVLQGLRSLIEDHFQGADIHTSQTHKKAFFILNTNTIDIVITDLSVSDYLSELNTPRKIKRVSDKIKVIIYSMHCELAVVQTLLSQKIDGYVAKSSSISDIPRAIEYALQDKRFFSPSVSKLLEKECQEYENPVLFTRREKEIIRMIVDGKSSVQIGKKLNVTVNTVEVHRKNIFRKTNSKNMAELTKKALQHGII